MLFQQHCESQFVTEQSSALSSIELHSVPLSCKLELPTLAPCELAKGLKHLEPNWCWKWTKIALKRMESQLSANYEQLRAMSWLCWGMEVGVWKLEYGNLWKVCKSIEHFNANRRQLPALITPIGAAVRTVANLPLTIRLQYDCNQSHLIVLDEPALCSQLPAINHWLCGYIVCRFASERTSARTAKEVIWKNSESEYQVDITNKYN